MGDLSVGSTAIVTTATDPTINFRGDPSTNNDPIGTLARGLAVLITGAPVGAFFPVRTPSGQSGWAAGAYLMPAPAAVPAVVVPPPGVVVVPAAEPALNQPAPATADGSRRKMLIIGGAALLGLGLVVAMTTHGSVSVTAKRK